MESPTENENQTSLVSVILPTYNGVKWIGAAVESVLSQSYARLELLIVDDGSSESIEKIIAPYQKDPRVRFFRQGNAGPGGARNTGIGHAKGDYFAFIDDDDIWERDKLEKQIACMERDPSCIVCYTDARNILPSGVLAPVTRKYSDSRLFSGKILKKIVFHNFVTLSSAVVKKEALVSVHFFTADRAFYMIEDYDLWLKLAPLGNFCVIDAPLVRYRTRPPIARAAKIKNYRSLVALYIQRIKFAEWKNKCWYCIGFAIVTVKYFCHRAVALFAV